jgi:hypothetical protein
LTCKMHIMFLSWKPTMSFCPSGLVTYVRIGLASSFFIASGGVWTRNWEHYKLAIEDHIIHLQVEHIFLVRTPNLFNVPVDGKEEMNE